MNLPQELPSFFQGEIDSDPVTLKKYSRDASVFEVEPQVVVFPRDVKDLQQLVRFVSRHKGVSLTARSGGTDMGGGPLGESIVVDINRHMNHITKIDDHAHTVTTEPGVFYRDLEEATLKYNLLLPSYPASREICTIGGMVANNAGGEKTLSYGKTEKYIEQLKVILADGEEHAFGKLTRAELEEKIKQKDFVGDIYRQVFRLVEDNYDLIKKAKPHVTKNSAGYNLWNVWDRKFFDITQLFVGSQGTLGIFTEITLRLVTPQPHSQLLVIFLHDLENLARIIEQVLKYQPESFESYDDHTLQLALRYLPDVIHQMKGKNFLHTLWQFLPEARLIMRGGLPKMILLADFTGRELSEVKLRAQAAQAALKQFSGATRLTASEAEAKKYWVIRRESFNLLRHHVQDKHTAPFIDDIIVRPEQLPQFLPELNTIMSNYKLIYTIAGHIGDANFHIIPLMNLADPKERQIIPELGQKVYELVLKYGGSISGEHNDGIVRSYYLKQMYGDTIYHLFEETKKIFDPHNIFNPGKKVGSSLKYAMDHLIQE